MATETLPPQSVGPSQTSSSESSLTDWDSLEPSAPVDPEVLTPVEPQPDRTAKPGTGVCPVCGEPVEREPGQLRRRKYHEECRPLKTVASTGSRTTRSRNSKAEAEADEAIANFKSLCLKGILMVSAVDQYDAFCCMVSLPEICQNLRALLVRYDGMRKEFLAMSTGGSIIGLILSLVMCAIPILAHHGLFPRKWRITQLMVNMPMTMYKIQQQLKNGEENLAKLLKDQMEKFEEVKRAAARANAAATVVENA